MFLCILISLDLMVSGVIAKEFSKVVKSPRMLYFSDLQKGEEYAPGEILVKFKASVSQARINSINFAFSASVLDIISEISVCRIGIPVDTNVSEMIEKYSIISEVEFAEPNRVYHALISPLMIPTDSYYSRQWALPKIEAPAAWDIKTRGKDIIVAIVDTGVDLYHPDLENQLVWGYDFVNDDFDPMDDCGHGTHCAGIAAAEANNGIGVAGLSWDAKIMPIKVLNAEGSGGEFDIAHGIIWAAYNGADVVSLSIGGYSPSYTIKDAIDYAYSGGCLVIAAVGNDNIAQPMYPAAYENVIAVSATNKDDGKAYYSNYGSYIDVSAPGGEMSYYHDERGILSTMPTYHVTLNDEGYSEDYDYLQGTSMACPYVAGLAAFALSRSSHLNNEDVKKFIQDYADDLGNSQYFGSGRINAYRTVNAIPRVIVHKISEAKSFPNPFKLYENDKITISFPVGMGVTIRIYNLVGQLVRTLDEEGTEVYKDKGEAYWNGRNDNGNKVSSGLYIYVIQGGGKKGTGKITLIK